MAQPSIRDVLKKSDFILMGICVVLAAGFLVLAGKNAATFVAIPAMTMRERGIHPFAVGDELSAARAAEHVHFEGGTGLFGRVLGGLLALTMIEVVLAYIKIQDLRIFLTILMGLSLVKAALIVAYFMHLKFERLSLVLTLVPTLVVCICLLFIVFPDSFRTREQRAVRPTAAATTGEPE